MNPSPKLSVCMITHNQERYIEQAVRSALMQKTEFEYEIVIGEDCSTDRTREILQRLNAEHSGCLRLLLPDRNLGAVCNFRETYAACQGEYVALLEGDDYWTDPHKLQRQVQALTAHPDWSACFHPVRYVNQLGEDSNIIHPRHAPLEVTIRDLFEQNLIQTCSLVLRRQRMPTMPEWFLNLKLDDWPLVMLLSETGPIGFLPETMADYRRHPDGVWSPRDPLYHLQEVLTMFAELDRRTDGRYAADIRKARNSLLADAYSDLQRLRTSLSYRLGFALTAPLRLVCDFVSRQRRPRFVFPQRREKE
ncbi:MAG TPA: glycosyltransferase [Gemmataceae bacterium]|nr:glycosyltransferase [Gemmataceae bacterium]